MLDQFLPAAPHAAPAAAGGDDDDDHKPPRVIAGMYKQLNFCKKLLTGDELKSRVYAI
jgi:hypothetical protein